MDDLLIHCSKYFKTLYNEPVARVEEPQTLPLFIYKMIADEDNHSLLTILDEVETRKAAFAIGADKSPGPDGFNGKFYHIYWHLLAGEVVCMVRFFFTTGTFAPNLNETSMVLIAQKDGAHKLFDFRPISLCNVTYKIISKLLVTRLRPLLNKCISRS